MGFCSVRAAGEGLGAPRIPVDRVAGVLEEVGTALASQAVGHQADLSPVVLSPIGDQCRADRTTQACGPARRGRVRGCRCGRHQRPPALGRCRGRRRRSAGRPDVPGPASRSRSSRHGRRQGPCEGLRRRADPGRLRPGPHAHAPRDDRPGARHARRRQARGRDRPGRPVAHLRQGRGRPDDHLLAVDRHRHQERRRALRGPSGRRGRLRHHGAQGRRRAPLRRGDPEGARQPAAGRPETPPLARDRDSARTTSSGTSATGGPSSARRRAAST